jgi:hypothetical protein
MGAVRGSTTSNNEILLFGGANSWASRCEVSVRLHCAVPTARLTFSEKHLFSSVSPMRTGNFALPTTKNATTPNKIFMRLCCCATTHNRPF